MAVLQQQTDIIDSASRKNEFDFSAGFGFAAAAGYQIAEPWRVEAEISYRTAEIASIVVGNIRTGKGGGTYSATAGMINGYLDIGRSNVGDFQPYLGLGFGAAWVRAVDFTSPRVTLHTIDKLAFAYQLMGGVSYRINDRLKVSLDYRWFATDRLGSGVQGIGGREADLEYYNHNLGVSLRYLF